MQRRLVGGIVAGGLLAAAFPFHLASAAPSAAVLDAHDFSAASQAETLLRVTSAGRFAVSVHSATGTALDLVDMITGPTPLAGLPGSVDGRLDALLDTGTYKIRLHPAADAQGDMKLAVMPFADVAAPAAMPVNAASDATLADLQQRSFWFRVSDATPIRLEAAGRALADFRIWRNGRDLVTISSATRIIEPTQGHPLRDILISNTLPPGTYLATAYGGPALPWADGTPDLPLHVRAGSPDTLQRGWAGGRVGPFGHDVFRAASHDDLIQLSAPGPATLLVDGSAATIDNKSRVSVVQLRPAATQGNHWVDVSAPAGTPYQLRAEMIGLTTSVHRPGTAYVTVNSTGLGGDDVPATFILARTTTHSWSVVDSNAPVIGPGHVWHHRFNLGGQASVLFQVPAGGRIAASITGVRLGQLDLVALDALAYHPPEQPESPGVWNVPAGWYALTLAPAGNTQGVADVTLGPPGMTVPLAPPAPPGPSITFGERSLASNETLRVFGNTAPDSAFGLDARPAPIALDGDPLRLSQAPGQALDIPIKPNAGRLTAVEYGAGSVPVTYDAASGIALLPPTDHFRLLTVFWDKPAREADTPAPAPEAARVMLQDRTARFFDLVPNSDISLTLTIGAGGLFRVETLGRLHTVGSIGSRFAPELERADANGTGQNMLLQGFLRAGQYHVDVAAVDSAGRAGIVASPALLMAAPALLPGGSVRATMRAGAGLVIPVSIARPGKYRIDLLGLGKTFNARVEDSAGWPFAASAPFDTATLEFTSGNYRLLVSPNVTSARVVARLTRIEAPPPLAGHGPHRLAFDTPQIFVWREPAGRTDPRVPDRWDFTLAAPADVTLSITDGMEANLGVAGGRLNAHLVGGAPFAGRLKAGAYTVQATSQGRNDRLDYTLSLAATQLQPGVARSLSLPASVTFSVASDRVVCLTSFGGTPVRAVLKDGGGHVLGRFSARDDDWSLGFSQLLPAGDYTLDLASAAPPPLHATPRNINDVPSGSREAPSGQDNADDPTNGPEPQQGFQGAGQDDAQAAAETELTLSLPEEMPPVPLQAGGTTLAGGGVHRLSLPAAAAGQLILAGASSSTELVLSLEQQDGNTWRNRALAQGLAPIVAVPPDGSGGAWRLSVWALDGGNLPIQAAAAIVAIPAIPGQPRLVPAPLPGVSASLAVAHVALPSLGLLALSGPPGESVLAGSGRGHPVSQPQSGLIVPQNSDLWLIAPRPDPLALTPLQPGSSVTLTLHGSTRAVLPVVGSSLAAWIADAPGQPGLDAGHGMGVAAGSAFTVATGTQAKSPSAALWNAGDEETLRVTARPIALTEAPAQPFDGRPTYMLSAATATVLHVPPGLHCWHVDLPPGTAAIAGWPGPHAVVAWAGHVALGRTLQGDWNTLLLVNTTPAPASIGLAMEAPTSLAAIDRNHAAKQFFGAAGSLDIAVSGAIGQSLVTAGDATATFVGEDGTVRQGSRVALQGSGRLILRHGAGLVAAWLEGAGAAPWPMPKPMALSLPARLPLSGQAMQFGLAPVQPSLLRIRSSAPVILSINGAPPILCPAGAATSRYLPAGPAVLAVIAPQDGGLAGSIELVTAPVRRATEGLGEPVTVSPGDAALFAFDLAGPTRLGIALRAEPDDARFALLAADGRELAAGAALLRDLPAGHYILSASVPSTAPTTVLRAVILGLKPRPNGPPPDVIRFYRELAGLAAPKDAAP